MLLACAANGPDSLSTTTSPAPASWPTRICASSFASAASLFTGSATITRHGCSRLAELAASMDSSRSASLSGAMTRVSTLAKVNAPPSWRSASSRLLIALVLVASSSTIIGVLDSSRNRSSGPPPFPAGPAQHLERRTGSPVTGLIRVGSPMGSPVFERGIQYLPR